MVRPPGKSFQGLEKVMEDRLDCHSRRGLGLLFEMALGRRKR